MRFSLSALLALCTALLASCGGGGNSGGGNPNPPGGNNPTLPPMALSFYADSAHINSGVTPTLRWISLASGCTAGGGWSGAKAASGRETLPAVSQTTTFSISCTAPDRPASTASLTIVAGSAAPPAPTTSKVWSEANVTSLDFARVPYGIRESVWSEGLGLIYGITSPGSPTAPNSLISIDPLTLATQVLPLGHEAWTIRLTTTDEFIYVGMSRGGGVRRIRTSDFTEDLHLPIGDAFTSIQRVVPSPVAPRTFVVLANRVPDEYAQYGLFIFDDGVMRPARIDGVGENFIDADWRADGALIYASSNPGGLVEVAVAADGAHIGTHHAWPTASPGAVLDGRYHSWDGRVFSLSGPVHLHAKLPDDYFSTAFRLPVPERGKYFSVGANLDGNVRDGTRVVAFDFDSYAHVDSIVFNGAANFEGGLATVWGSDGIFLTSESGSIVARGTFAAAGGRPLAFSSTLPLWAAGVARGNSDAVNYRIIDMNALGIATNSCGRLYVTTTMNSRVRPGSVVEVNPDDLSIVRSTVVGVEPWLLAGSNDCSTLYVGSRYRSSVTRIRTSDLTITDELPLGNEYPSGARSISVAPGQEQTVAVAMGEIGFSTCTPDRGVVIYDGNIPRPVYWPDTIFGIQSIVFGANPGVLYGEDFFDVHAFDVGAAGLTNRRHLFRNPLVSANYGIGRDLYFDSVANRLFNSYGNVFDIPTNTQLPVIPLLHPLLSGGCGIPAQTRVSDPVTGKFFMIGQGMQLGTLGVSAFARNGLARVGDVQFGQPDEMGRLGSPDHVVRLPGNRLAFVTERGYLVIVEGAMLAP